MNFEEKLKANREAYLAAKVKNKALNAEVATRNNIKSISVVTYKTSSGRTVKAKAIVSSPD